MTKGKKQRRVAEGKLRLIVGGATINPPGPSDPTAPTESAPRASDDANPRAVVRLVRAGALERTAERPRDARPSRPAALRQAATALRTSAGRAPERIGDVAADEPDRDSLIVPRTSLFSRVPAIVYVVLVAAIAAIVVAALVARNAPKVAPTNAPMANVTLSPTAPPMPNAPNEAMSAAAPSPSSSAAR
jgi:hypothetical protein